MEKKKIEQIKGNGIGVMMLKNRKILLGKRHINPKNADSALKGSGAWTMPGGKLEFQESFEEAAIREVSEETSIKIRNPKVICVNNDIVENAHFVTIGLLATEFSGTAKIIEPDEITEWKWFASHELPKNLYFPSKKILENFKQKKFYVKN